MSEWRPVKPNTMVLKLQQNVQFIYELALARMELAALGVDFDVAKDLRLFNCPNPADSERLRRRLAYFESVDGAFTDYHHIQRYNRTRSLNQYLTHWIYPYKGKYHPQMVRSLLNIVGPQAGGVVLDPFIGSGTTAVETQLLGIHCIGIDISPLCVLISKVKTESVEVLDEIMDVVHAASPSHAFPSQSSLFFTQDIDAQPDGRVRNFVKMAEMIAYSDQSRRRKDFGRSFQTNIHRMAASVKDFKEAAKSLGLTLGRAEIIRADARNLPVPDSSVDAIITSPPYSIALDYVQNDAHALEALGYDLSTIRKAFIGVRGTGLNKFELYNQDMAVCFREMYRVLKTGRYCVIVMGNVTYQGREIDTVGTTVRECGKAGLRLVTKVDKIIFGLYSVMQREYILIFFKG